MPEFRVKFVGDLGNLKQFDAAIRNSAGESARQLQAANNRIVSQAGTGFKVANQQTIVDAYNNTFRQIGTRIRQSITGYETELSKATGKYVLKPVVTDEYINSFDVLRGNVEKHNAALKRTAVTEKQVLELRKQSAAYTATIQNRQKVVQDRLDLREAQYNLRRSEIRNPITSSNPRLAGVLAVDEIARLQRQLLQVQHGQAIRTTPYPTLTAYAGGPRTIAQRNPFGTQPGDNIQTVAAVQAKILELTNLRQQAISAPITTTSQRAIANRAQEIQHLQADLANSGTTLRQGVVEIRSYMTQQQQIIARGTSAITAEIARLEQVKLRLGASDAKLLASTNARIAALRGANPAYAQARGALGETPPINTDLQRALDTSKQLKGELLRAGLGAGAIPGSKQFQENLALQEAQVTKYTKNLRTNVSTIQAQFRQFNPKTGEFGSIEQLNVDIDKNGKVIKRWGGQLAGAGGALRQTVRDFQKVIEWTVATTLVFGGLALVVGQLKGINELNESLARFSITAQLSAEDTKDLFGALGQVSIATATPLNELVKVADDIALATKKAGDSTEEWKGKIIDLTTAVGIFTNLTGEDTISAADKLSSTFKQLGIVPDQLVGVLSKVTAVTGGQSTAINEVVTALSSVAEAGAAAQLSLDEQIATVQILGQVTSKSAADIATAFKNLFGALNSPASEKILGEFGISLRKVNGDLRPFLEVYREINQALIDGIIPAGRYQDVLRGISGGPRRAPDAAAIIGNLALIEDAIKTTEGATNEALIANAKILDTNNAKIIQFQNAFDIAIFEKFGEVIADITESLTGFGTLVLQGFNLISAPIIAATLQLGAFLVVGKLIGVSMSSLRHISLGVWSGISASILSTTASLKAYIAQVAFANAISNSPLGLNRLYRGEGQTNRVGLAPFPVPTTGNKLRGLLSPTAAQGGIANLLGGLSGPGKALLLAGGVAAAGAGFAAIKGDLSTEGVDPQALGSVLTMVGALSLMTGTLAPLGIAAIAAGTAISFLGGESEKVKKSAFEVAQEVHTLNSALTEARKNVDLYTQLQSDSRAVLDNIIESGKTDVETKNAQVQATNDFVEATLNLVDANAQVETSLQAVIDKIPGLSEKYEVFKNSIKSGAISPADSKSLQESLNKEILQGTGYTFFNTLVSDIPKTYVPTSKNANAPRVVDAGSLGGSNQFNLSSLLQDPTLLDKLFTEQGGSTEEIVNALKDGLNLGFAQSALAQLPDLITNQQADGITPERFTVLADAIQRIAETSSSYSANAIVLTQQQAGIQSKLALGIFTQEQGVNASRASSLASQLNVAQENDTRAGPSTRTAQEIQDVIAKLKEFGDTGLELPTSELIKVVALMQELTGVTAQLGQEGKEAIGVGIYQALENMGLSLAQLDEAAKILGIDFQDLTARSQEFYDVFDQAKQKALGDFGDRALQLQIAENSGQYKDNPEGLEKLKKQNREALQSTIELQDSIKGLSNVTLVELNNRLQETIGLQGNFISTTEALTISEEDLATKVNTLIAQMYSNAVAAGVNAKGLRKITQEALILQAAIDAIQAYKQVIIDIKVLRTKVPSQLGNRFDIAESNAEKKQESASSNIEKTLKAIDKIIKSGSGSNFGAGSSATSGGGGGSGSGGGPDVSTLDLPDEIANATNRSALIRQAIKRARALQRKIPGAQKEGRNDIVELLKGTQRVLEVRGVKDDLLRRALEELADIEKKRLEFETKADTIRRIRVGAGDFSAIANVPLNSKTGVSLGSPNGPINVTLNLNGTLLTPAQFAAFADKIAAALKRQIGG